MPRIHYQPPHERLALLLEQLSELDPEADKRPKLEPSPEKKSESKLRFEAVPALRPKLEPVPIRKTEPAAVAPPVEVEKPEPMATKRSAAKSAFKPAQKTQTKKAAARKAAPSVKAKAQSKPKPLVKSKSRAKEAPSSFHAVLRSYAKDQVRLSPQAQARQPRPESNISPWIGLTQKGLLGALVRGWSWLNSKYKTSAAKRLRLSEVVQLGDKRFVALVKVEDREFLIGGGASGLSLLSPLEAAGGTVEMRKRGIGSGGKSR
jgi:hypothetical protein